MTRRCSSRPLLLSRFAPLLVLSLFVAAVLANKSDDKPSLDDFSQDERNLLSLLLTDHDVRDEKLFDSAWNKLPEHSQHKVATAWISSISRRISERKPTTGTTHLQFPDLLSSAIPAAEYNREDEDIVSTASGDVRGIVTERSTAFLGIPFGQDTGGENRFKDPIPVHSWAPSIHDATSYPVGCMQSCTMPEGTCPHAVSEDCLTFIVFSPRSSTPSNPAPVMVWIYGGRFESGTAHCEIYLGKRLAERAGVVLVLPNYRLAAFGFLSGENRLFQGAIMDQQLALKWVQNNILAFGGDPTSVTLFGQSAGAASVYAHVVFQVKTMGASPTFHRVIMESAPWMVPFKSPELADDLDTEFASALGCEKGDMPCYRAANSSEALRASDKAQEHVWITKPAANLMPWAPIVDPSMIPMDPWDAFRSGDIPSIPMLMGVTAEEAIPFVWGILKDPATAKRAKSIIATIMGKELGNLLWERYENPDIEDKRYVLSEIATDYIFRCSARVAARGAIEAGAPVHLFDVNQALSFPGWGHWTECNDHACHGVELVYVFNTPDASDDPEKQYHFTEDELVLSHTIQDFYGNFAHTGDPNKGPHDPGLEWPQWQPEEDLEAQHWMLMQAGATQDQPGHLAEICDWMEDIGVFDR